MNRWYYDDEPCVGWREQLEIGLRRIELERRAEQRRNEVNSGLAALVCYLMVLAVALVMAPVAT
jgi:hypothetical protein